MTNVLWRCAACGPGRRVRDLERYVWTVNEGVDEEAIISELTEDIQRDVRRHLFLQPIKKVWEINTQYSTMYHEVLPVSVPVPVPCAACALPPASSDEQHRARCTSSAGFFSSYCVPHPFHSAVPSLLAFCAGATCLCVRLMQCHLLAAMSNIAQSAFFLLCSYPPVCTQPFK